MKDKGVVVTLRVESSGNKRDTVRRLSFPSRNAAVVYDAQTTVYTGLKPEEKETK